jgi:ketosteroid isomerase-like protein
LSAAEVDERVLERIKRSYELFNETGAFEADLFAADVEWHNTPEMPGADVHRGRAAVLAEIAAQGEAWESRRAQPLEFLPAGDKVAVVVCGLGVGKASHAEVRQDVVHVWTVNAGMVTRVEAFLDAKAGLRAAGITYNPSSDR